MKVFPGLPVPVHSETFSSWVFRCSMNQHLTLSNRLDLQANPDCTWEGWRASFEDPDFDFKSDFFCQTINILAIDRRTVAKFFRAGTEDIVAWDRRCLFCESCLRSDVEMGRLPAWRRNWCEFNSVMCPMHKSELSILNGRPTFSKAWDAFVQMCNAKRTNTRWDDGMFIRLRFLSLNWINRRMNLDSVDHGAGAVRLHLFNKLYRVFLQLPTRRSNGGVARTFFSARQNPKHSDAVTYRESLFCGAGMSNARSRLGCLILLGILFDLIPESLILSFVKHCESANIYFPDLRGIENVIYLGNVDREEYHFLHSYLGEFPRSCWARLDVFLNLQEDRYVRDGVSNGARFGERGGERSTFL